MALRIALVEMRRVVGEALGVLFPVECAGCARPGADLCDACSLALAPRPRVERRTGLAPIVAAHGFSGEVARVLRALKQDGRTGLVGPLAVGVRAAAEHGLRYVERTAGAPLLLVPVPSSRRARRRRGFAVNERLARRAGLRCSSVLSAVRAVADQRGLRRAERERNVAGSLRADRAVSGCDVVLFDDVVTTGATLREASRAISLSGGRVLLCVVLAATRRNSSERSRDIHDGGR